MKRTTLLLAACLGILAPSLFAAANDVYITQRHPTLPQNIQRTVTPVAGQVLGFNAQLEPVMLALTGGGGGSYTFTASDFNESGSTVSIDYVNGQAASAATKGFLTAADWSLFDAKLGTSAIGSTVQAHSAILDGTTASFTTALETKLAGIQTGAQANAALASQAEAEAGTDNTKTMTPLRVAQAISVLGGGGSGITDGDKGDIIVSGGGTVFTLDALDELDVGTLNVTSLGSTIIPGANGGTGVANTGKTITLGGNVTMSGAYSFTGTLTANTSVTYPTSGTLANTAYVDAAVGGIGSGNIPAGAAILWPTANIASPPSGHFAAGEYGTATQGTVGGYSVIVPSLGTVANPTPSTPSGAVAAGTVITLSSTTLGAFFTTTNNTTDPTYTVGAVGNTFTVNEAGTWEVRANKQGYVSSAVQSFTYTISGGGGSSVWDYSVDVGSTNSVDLISTVTAKGSKITASESGTCDKLAVEVGAWNTPSNVKAVLYDLSGNVLGTGTVSAPSDISNTRLEVTLSSPVAGIVSGTVYRVAFLSSVEGAFEFKVLTGQPSGTGFYSNESYAAFPTDPVSINNHTHNWCVAMRITP